MTSRLLTSLECLRDVAVEEEDKRSPVGSLRVNIVATRSEGVRVVLQFSAEKSEDSAGFMSLHSLLPCIPK